MGLSGSGKTTLVALLQRLYDPSSGAILLDGETDLRHADAEWYRQQIGVVSQVGMQEGVGWRWHVGAPCDAS